MTSVTGKKTQTIVIVFRDSQERDEFANLMDAQQIEVCGWSQSREISVASPATLNSLLQIETRIDYVVEDRKAQPTKRPRRFIVGKFVCVN